MKISKALKDYEPYYEKILKTGSRVICSPAPEDTDEDYLILIKPDQREALETLLQADGWTLGGSLPNGGIENGDWTLNTQHEYIGGRIDHSRVFHSWKRYETPGESGSNDFGVSWVTQGTGPEINLLVTCNEQYFDDFTRATFLCQGLNLLEKEDRVTVFEALTRDVWPTGPKKKKKKFLFEYDAVSHEALINHFHNTNTILQQMPMQTATEVAEGLANLAVNPPVVAVNIPPGEFLISWGEGTTESNFPEPVGHTE